MNCAASGGRTKGGDRGLAIGKPFEDASAPPKSKIRQFGIASLWRACRALCIARRCERSGLIRCSVRCSPLRRRPIPVLQLVACAIFMMPPEEYRAARAAASHWLQLQCVSLQEPDRLPGVCLVRAEVVRTFRGPPPLTKTIELEIDCKKRGERGPPGDEFRIDAEDLVPGRHLEAFAEVRGARYAVVARQVELIAKPAEKPTFTGKE